MTRKYIDPNKAKIVDGEVRRTAPPPDQIAFEDKQTDVMLSKVRGILVRELNRLEGSSQHGGLSKDDSQILISYSKELREWKKEEKEEVTSLSEDELEALINPTK